MLSCFIIKWLSPVLHCDATLDAMRNESKRGEAAPVLPTKLRGGNVRLPISSFPPSGTHYGMCMVVSTS